LLAKRCKLAKKALANVSGELLKWFFWFVYFPSSEDLVLTKARQIIVYVCPYMWFHSGLDIWVLWEHLNIITLLELKTEKNPSILFSCGLSNKLQRIMEWMKWTCKRTQLELITLVYITSMFYKEDFVQTKQQNEWDDPENDFE
jgi:hypothetical protein